MEDKHRAVWVTQEPVWTMLQCKACWQRESSDTWACSTHKRWKHLLCILNIVNYDGDEHTVTKVLTQTDTSCENKLAAQLAWTVGWQLVEKRGRCVWKWGSHKCSNPSCVWNRGFISQVMQLHVSVKLWFPPIKYKCVVVSSESRKSFHWLEMGWTKNTKSSCWWERTCITLLTSIFKPFHLT